MREAFEEPARRVFQNLSLAFRYLRPLLALWLKVCLWFEHHWKVTNSVISMLMPINLKCTSNVVVTVSDKKKKKKLSYMNLWNYKSIFLLYWHFLRCSRFYRSFHRTISKHQNPFRSVLFSVIYSVRMVKLNVTCFCVLMYRLHFKFLSLRNKFKNLFLFLKSCI